MSLRWFAALVFILSLAGAIAGFVWLFRIPPPWVLTLVPSQRPIPAARVLGLNLVLGSIGEGLPELDQLIATTHLRVPPRDFRRIRYFFRVDGATEGTMRVGNRTYAFEDGGVVMDLKPDRCYPVEVRLRGLRSKVRLVYKKYQFSEFRPLRWPLAAASCENSRLAGHPPERNPFLWTL